jgi:hypothetical protein
LEQKFLKFVNDNENKNENYFENGNRIEINFLNRIIIVTKMIKEQILLSEVVCKICLAILPAAACLLDPSFADALLSPDLSSLLNAAKMIISTLFGQQLPTLAEFTSDSKSAPPALKRFKFLATWLETSTASSQTASTSQGTVLNQLNRCISDSADRYTCTSSYYRSPDVLAQQKVYLQQAIRHC